MKLPLQVVGEVVGWRVLAGYRVEEVVLGGGLAMGC